MAQIYTPIDINQIEQDIPHLITAMQWVQDFVAKSHPRLGRSGPVCPFVPHSIRANSMWLAVLRTKNLSLDQIADIVLGYKDVFLEQYPQEGVAAIKKTLLVILPDVDVADAPKIIDGTQKKLKPYFVEAGLMIGEFHKRNQVPGAHNPNFYPFQSPIPMFAIRHMVESDILFLKDEDPQLRIKYLEAYLKHLEKAYSQRFNQKIKDETKLTTALQLLTLAREQLQLENMMNLDIADGTNLKTAIQTLILAREQFELEDSVTLDTSNA